jgi:tRNA modification GTPase
VVDEAICLIFPAPRSYTGEDVVEFQCHGGLAVMRRALQAVFAAGAQPAAPGEFTRRAYLNGRIDLAKAEAVMQIVSASSEQAARAASAAMGGALSKTIEEVRASLIATQAHIAAWVDYPDDDIPALQNDELAQVLTHAAASLKILINNAPRDQLMLSGINTALLGKPNVGKSSLMNRLAGFDRSIVTEQPGTTRDTITETVNLGNVTLRLTDTAGMRETSDSIEAAGVARSRAALAQAELLLLVCDASQELTDEDHALLNICDPARTILIFNKCDLAIAARPPANFISINVSARTGQGLEALISSIETLLNTADFSPNEAILANARQTSCAAQALAALKEARAAATAGYPLDAISICIEDAIQFLYALTGERATDAVVDEVFASFCVGK